jgi:hypothetical protein
MFHQFNHRYGTFQGADGRTNVHLPNPTLTDRQNPSFIVYPWYWVARKETIKKLEPNPEWILAFRDIVRSTDERTGIFSLIPWSALSNKAPILLLGHRLVASSLLANLNAVVFDFVIRQKIGGTSLNFYIVKQLPVLPPDRYTPDLLDVIVPRVVELTYTAWDLQPFAQDVLGEVGEETWARWFADAPIHDSPPPAWAAGDTPAPFVWDEERRAVLRAELDALYAHLYGLTRDELAYILDTFPIVKRKDEAQYGEYRTKRMILEKYEETEPLAR